MTSETHNSGENVQAAEKKASLVATIMIFITLFFIAQGFYLVSTAKGYIEPYERNLYIAGFCALGIGILLIIGVFKNLNKKYYTAKSLYFITGILASPLGIFLILCYPNDEGLLYLIAGILDFPASIFILISYWIMKSSDSKAGLSLS